MEVYLNKIAGWDDAAVALHESKFHLTPSTEAEIRNAVRECISIYDGSIYPSFVAAEEERSPGADYIKKVLRYGAKHTTLLRFIDLTFSVYGLHRAGQDDWDSHAKRFDNRIIRASSRIKGNDDAVRRVGFSDYYADKVMTTEDALDILDISIPDTFVDATGQVWYRCLNGYVREEDKDNQDALRGLYSLGFASNFTFKVNLCEFAHVYRMRNSETSANPEVKELAEECIRLLNQNTAGLVNRGYVLNINN